LKKILALVMAFCLVSLCALSEETPDGVMFDAYRVKYESSVIDGYGKIQYRESEGLLFSAYGDDTDIAVSVEVNEEAKDAKEFLSAYRNNVSKYAKVLLETDLGAWKNPTGNEGSGMRITHMHERAKSEEDAFVTDVFAAQVSEGKFLLCTFSCSAGNAENLLKTENEFFFAFDLEACRVSKTFMAYLTGVRKENEKIYLSVDYCSVEYDASIFTIYSVNPDKTTHEYVLNKNALLWTPVIDEALYSQKETAPDAEEIAGIIENYRNQKKADAIYRILFNEENEIIWMMHYNAF